MLLPKLFLAQFWVTLKPSITPFRTWDFFAEERRIIILVFCDMNCKITLNLNSIFSLLFQFLRKDRAFCAPLYVASANAARSSSLLKMGTAAAPATRWRTGRLARRRRPTKESSSCRIWNRKTRAKSASSST